MTRLRCDISTSCRENSLYWNSAVNNGAPSSIKPAAAGSATSITQRKAQSRVLLKAALSLPVCSAERLGRMTVASAMPNTPRGNSTSLSEKYSQEILPVSRKEAIAVSTSRLIWLTETANRVGIISVIILPTPSRSRLNLGSGNSLSLSRNGNWNSNCATPAINTPQASATTRCSGGKYGVSHKAQPISDRLSNTGVNAGTAKRR